MSKPSQDDVIADNTRLTGELTTMRTEVARLTSENTRLTGERDTRAATVTALTSERDALKAERDKLAAADRDFERRVSAELAQHGIRKEGVATPAGAGSTDLVAQYEALTDPKEKAAFVVKHEKELRSLIKQA
jgi:peptidoglycan hydrolase CwlO-like protein